MKKTSIILLAVALFGILSAFTNIPTLGSEKIVAIELLSGKYYVQVDQSNDPVIVNPQWEQGEEYRCDEDEDLCTITLTATADPDLDLHQDVNGFYYDATDVASSVEGLFVEN